MKMKLIKRISAFGLILVLLLGVIPAGDVYAAETYDVSKNLTAGQILNPGDILTIPDGIRGKFNYINHDGNIFSEGYHESNISFKVESKDGINKWRVSRIQFFSADNRYEVDMNPATPLKHDIIVENDGNGTASANYTQAEKGTVVTLTATPNAGYRFKEWKILLNGITITDNKFTMINSRAEVKAIFELIPVEYSITVDSDGNGTAGANVSQALKGTDVTLTATPNSGFRFKEWQVTGGGVSIADNKFTMPEDNVKITAIFEAIPQEYTITVESGGNGTASASPDKALAGTEIKLTAVPDSGYQFKEWQVIDGNINIEDSKFSMTESNVTVKAIFEPIINEYSITILPIENGTITASAEAAGEGTEIELTAVPADGYRFKSWQVTSDGTPIPVTDNKFTMPDGAVSVGAAFEKIPVVDPKATEYNITVKTDGHGTAKANVKKAEKDQVVELTATPDKGYKFKEWEIISGDVTITDNTFVMPDEDVTVKAIFKPTTAAVTEYSITVVTDGNGIAKAKPSKAEEGTKIQLYATANKGYRFKEWKILSGDVKLKNHTFTMPAKDVKIKAVFEKKKALAKTSTKRTSRAARTGDTSSTAIFLTMLLLSGAVFTAAIAKRRRNYF